MKTTNHENLPQIDKPPTTDASKDPAVQKAIDLIKRTLVGASKTDLTSKYLVGAKVEEIRTSTQDEKYGKKVVVTIARSVGLTASCLYQYADVARAWGQVTFDEASPRAATAGLTFSHFIELARKDHASHRHELLEETIEKGLSVRDLRKHRAGSEEPRKKIAAIEQPKLDVLERLAVEGPTEEVRAAIDAELEELHRQDAELQRRAEKLEAARTTWTAARTECDSELGKAAE
jgi:hypothetical protein